MWTYIFKILLGVTSIHIKLFKKDDLKIRIKLCSEADLESVGIQLILYYIIKKYQIDGILSVLAYTILEEDFDKPGLTCLSLSHLLWLEEAVKYN